MRTLSQLGLSQLQARTTGVIRSAADPCGTLKTDGLELKVADNRALRGTAELDELHRIQFRHGDRPEKPQSLETSSQHLDPARRQVPVSKDLR